MKNRLTFICQLYAQFGGAMIPVECRSEKTLQPPDDFLHEPHGFSLDLAKSTPAEAKSLNSMNLCAGARCLVFIQNRTGMQLNVRPTEAEQQRIDTADAVLSVDGTEIARVRSGTPMIFEPADLSQIKIHAPHTAVRLRVTIIPLEPA